MPAFAVAIFALASVVFAGLMTFALRRWAPKLGLVDIPNDRSSHKNLMPRGGGLSFVVVVTVMTAVAIFSLKLNVTPGMWALLLSSLMVAIVSLADDRWHLPILVRLGAHCAAALIFMASAGWIREVVLPGGAILHLAGWGFPLTFIWIVGLTNAFNFMDGIDGLAAGQAIIAAATLAWLAQVQGSEVVSLTMAIVAGSVLGFIPHNWPPARIFMGDVGSAFLGFTFAGWAVLTRRSGSEPLSFFPWAVMMAPFIFDTGATLILRIIRKKPLYIAHRDHFYQRLIRNGWGHLAVTRLYLVIAVFLSIATIAFYGYSKISVILFAGIVVVPLAGIVLLVRLIEFRSKMRTT